MTDQLVSSRSDFARLTQIDRRSEQDYPSYHRQEEYAPCCW